jgi:hypothetical protein
MAAQTEVKTEPEFKPLCIWCSAPWSDKNVKLEIEGASYCECGKLMYEKSGLSYDY